VRFSGQIFFGFINTYIEYIIIIVLWYSHDLIFSRFPFNILMKFYYVDGRTSFLLFGKVIKEIFENLKNINDL